MTITKHNSLLRLLALAIAILLLGLSAAPDTQAIDLCAGFRIDVKAEHRLFEGPATSVTAGRTPSTAPSIAVGHLYALTLTPETSIQFRAAPGKHMLTGGAYAGLAKIVAPVTAIYRVSLDAPFWIDVVDHGRLLPAVSFQGLRTCHTPQKIVEFALRGGRNYVLQFSGGIASDLRVAVTPRPRTAP